MPVTVVSAFLCTGISDVSSRVTNSSCLARTFGVLKLIVLIPRRPLSSGQTWMVGHPCLLSEFCLMVIPIGRAKLPC